MNDTHDQLSDHLLAFYLSHHAMLRAKLSAWQLKDHSKVQHRKCLQRARDYLDVARSFLS